MRIFKSATYLHKYLRKLSANSKKIGFVPTMGALHPGHMSLIKAAKKKSDYVVASIFVNPTQFNDSKDLKKYPRTPSKDQKMLQDHGCDLLFMPSVEVMYPQNAHKTIKIDFGALDQVMEGAHRPGHFAAVAAVVKRLLDIVEPHGLYMGQKDFQQTAIIDHMIKWFKLKTELVVCPIIREKDGLAMSSRNRRLTQKYRIIAPIISKTLRQAKSDFKEYTVEKIEQIALKTLESTDFKAEYFEIVDGFTLQPIKRKNAHKYVVACVAAWAGEIRLIDNIIIKK